MSQNVEHQNNNKNKLKKLQDLRKTGGEITMNYNSFHKLMKNKYALSTVVTTLIILVISVLLASVVTYFAINVVSTRVQEESLSLTNTHIWLNPSSFNQETQTTLKASVMVINTGGRDVVINKIAVRGQDCSWASTYQFIIYSITDQPVATDMYFQQTWHGSK